MTKVDTANCDIVHSSFLGGSGQDLTGGDKGDPAGNPIAVDAAGCAYVTGRTPSTDFPTASPFQGASSGDRDAFITKTYSDVTPIPNAFVYLPLAVRR